MSPHVSLLRPLAAAALVATFGAGAALAANTVTVPNGTVNTGAACGTGNPNATRFAGNCGALVSLDGSATSTYLEDDTPAAEGAYRVRLMINARGMVQGNPHGTQPDNVPLTSRLTNPLDIFTAYNSTPTDLFRVVLEPSTGGNDLTAFYRTDAGEVEIGNPPSGSKFLPAGWRAVEIRWEKNTAANAGDGRFALWVDGTLWANVTGLDIDLAGVENVRWGAVEGAGNASAGSSMRMDDFVSVRTGYIGPAVPFSDVPTSYFAFPFIQGAYSAEVIPGATSATFAPTAGVTRGSMARIILRGRYGSSFTPPSCTTRQPGINFADVPCPSHPEADWIYQLAFEGITGGCGGGNYCPNNTLTRAQMMAFLYASRAIFYTTGGSASCAANGFVAPFSDVPDNHFACAYIARAKADGLTGGCGGGQFCPSNLQQRDQMSVFVTQNYATLYNNELRMPIVGTDVP